MLGLLALGFGAGVVTTIGSAVVLASGLVEHAIDAFRDTESDLEDVVEEAFGLPR